MIHECCHKNNADLTPLASFLNAISKENRLRIVCLLQKNGEMCVCDIWKCLELPQNLASHHLKVLKDFGLLLSRKEGLSVYYSIDKTALSKYSKELYKLLG